MAYDPKSCNIIELSGEVTDEERARAMARMTDPVLDIQPTPTVQPGSSTKVASNLESEAPTFVPGFIDDRNVAASNVRLDKNQIPTVSLLSGSHPETEVAIAQSVGVSNVDAKIEPATITRQDSTSAKGRKAIRSDIKDAHNTAAKFGDHSVTLPDTTANIAFLADVKDVKKWLVHLVQYKLNSTGEFECTWNATANKLRVASRLVACSRSAGPQGNASAYLAASCCNLIDRRAYRIPLTMKAGSFYETIQLPMSKVMRGTSSATDHGKMLADLLNDVFVCGREVNARHLGISTEMLHATDFVSLFEKGWVQVFRLCYAERSGRQLELGYDNWNDFDWCEHMLEDEVGPGQIRKLNDIAFGKLPTLIAGLDETSGQSLTIWRMLASGGVVWPVAQNGLHCVADDIVWPKWRFGLVKLPCINRAVLEASSPQLPTSRNLVMWLYQLAASRQCHAQLFEGFHRACVLVGSNWKQVPLDADWPELKEGNIPIDSLPTRNNVGLHVGYRLTADQQRILSSRSTVIPVQEKKFRPWMEAGHNLTRDKKLVPSVFVVSGYNMLGMSTKRIPTPREANYFVRFLAEAIPREDNAMKDAAMNMINISIDNWDIVMAVMFQVIASCVSTLYMSANITGRELSALQANTEMPGRFLNFYYNLLASRVTDRPGVRGDVFHELVVHLVARSTEHAIPPKTLAFSTLTGADDLNGEFPPVAQLVLYTSPTLPPQPGTVLAIVALIKEYPCEWCIPLPGWKADLTTDIYVNSLRPWGNCSSTICEYESKSSPEMFIPYGNQVVNIVALATPSLRKHPEKRILREECGTSCSLVRDCAHQPMFIVSLGIFAPGNMLTYYWATVECVQPVWTFASADGKFLDRWRKGEVLSSGTGIYGHNSKPVNYVDAYATWKQVLRRLERICSSDSESGSTQKDSSENDERKDDDKADKRKKGTVDSSDSDEDPITACQTK